MKTQSKQADPLFEQIVSVMIKKNSQPNLPSFDEKCYLIAELVHRRYVELRKVGDSFQLKEVQPNDLNRHQTLLTISPDNLTLHGIRQYSRKVLEQRKELMREPQRIQWELPNAPNEHGHLLVEMLEVRQEICASVGLKAIGALHCYILAHYLNKDVVKFDRGLPSDSFGRKIVDYSKDHGTTIGRLIFDKPITAQQLQRACRIHVDHVYKLILHNCFGFVGEVMSEVGAPKHLVREIFAANEITVDDVSARLFRYAHGEMWRPVREIVGPAYDTAYESIYGKEVSVEAKPQLNTQHTTSSAAKSTSSNTTASSTTSNPQQTLKDFAAVQIPPPAPAPPIVVQPAVQIPEGLASALSDASNFVSTVTPAVVEVVKEVQQPSPLLTTIQYEIDQSSWTDSFRGKKTTPSGKNATVVAEASGAYSSFPRRRNITRSVNSTVGSSTVNETNTQPLTNEAANQTNEHVGYATVTQSNASVQIEPNEGSTETLNKSSEPQASIVKAEQPFTTVNSSNDFIDRLRKEFTQLIVLLPFFFEILEETIKLLSKRRVTKTDVLVLVCCVLLGGCLRVLTSFLWHEKTLLVQDFFLKQEYIVRQTFFWTDLVIGIAVISTIPGAIKRRIRPTFQKFGRLLFGEEEGYDITATRVWQWCNRMYMSEWRKLSMSWVLLRAIAISLPPVSIVLMVAGVVRIRWQSFKLRRKITQPQIQEHWIKKEEEPWLKEKDEEPCFHCAEEEGRLDEGNDEYCHGDRRTRQYE